MKTGFGAVDPGEVCVGSRKRECGFDADESAWSAGGGGVVGGDGDEGSCADDGGVAAGEEEMTICSPSDTGGRSRFAEGAGGGDEGSSS